MHSPETVLVTGASQGIGKAIVAKLASVDHRVLCVSRSKPEFHGSDQPQYADRITWNSLDLSDSNAVGKYAASLETASVNALILSAVDYGDGARHPASSTTSTEWQRVIATNLVGHCVLVSQLLPKLTRSSSGTIINISSDVAVLPAAGRSAYAASKAGLHAMLRAVEAELRSTGLRVYQLIPTFQSATEGIRRRRPEGFDFSSYATPTLIAEVVSRLLCCAGKSIPAGSYLIQKDGTLTPYQEVSSF